jgi:hypothetical protein
VLPQSPNDSTVETKLLVADYGLFAWYLHEQHQRLVADVGGLRLYAADMLLLFFR